MHSLISSFYRALQSKSRAQSQGSRIFLLGFSIAAICLVSLSALASQKAPITVDGRPGNPSGAFYAELHAAVAKADDGSRIVLSPGNHLVDNPVILRRPGLKLVGAGRVETILRPRNAGRPVFVLAAPGLTISDLAIDARVPNGNGRATFAIYIDAGVTGGKIAENQIIGTGASAVLGRSTRDFMVVGNEILDAGDDAIRLKGERLNISRNFILRYYDEAIDVIGANVTISDNYVRMGRAGITLEVSSGGVISSNTVSDHYHGGIFYVSRKGGNVFDNHVVDAGTVAYSLQTPTFVASNRVEGNNAVGFSIIDMTNGKVQHNVVADAEVGWSLERSSSNLIMANRLCGGKEPWRQDEQSIDNQLENNQFELHCDSLKAETDGAESRTEIRHSTLKSLEGVTLGNRYAGSLEVTGVSARDLKIAEHMATLLNKNNPGFISLHIDGDSMRSRITSELSQTLTGAGQLAVGVVRVPFKIFSMSRPAPQGLRFPLWHLIDGDRKVVVVAPLVSGTAARIFVARDQGLGWKNSATLLLLRLHRIWHYGSRKIVRPRVGIPAIVGLVAVVFGVRLLRRRRKRLAGGY